jgi:glutamate---cysteine ligase / carboxylate-amine ligase
MHQTLADSAAARSVAAPRKVDELTFHASPEATLGVELELMVLDRETGDLVSGAVGILKRCAEEASVRDFVSAELMQSMIEVKSSLCHNVREVEAGLVPVLKRVRNIARSMGYDLAMSGTHPFHRTSNNAVSPSERYDRIYDRLAYMIHQRVVFGLHVHVGVPSGDMAIGVINVLVQHLPHLLAISANSPFWQGIDSGLASCRTALFRSLPHAGVPRYFPRWKDFRTFFRVMRDCKAIQSTRDIYWDIRPRPELGTIEFRVCDIPATIATTLSLVALIRSLVVATERHLEEHPHLRRGDMRRHWIAVENKWLATRYGLNAMYIRTPGGKRRPLKQDLRDLIERLLPVAGENGDDKYLAALLPIEQFETGAERQRRLYREAGDWQPLVADMTERLSRELETATQGKLEQPEKSAARAPDRANSPGTSGTEQAPPHPTNGAHNND